MTICDFDEDYTYDDLDRLTDADRADAFDQSWGLDGLGNFSTFDDDGDSQTRTANAVNEITAITGGSITPTYDDAGNMISGPKPGDDATKVHYVYDAWNRLVEVREDDSGSPGDLIAEYVYDGLKRRIIKSVDGAASDVHYYYNQEWQMLEEVYVDGQEATVASNEYVPSPRYIDARIVRFHDDNGDGDYEDAGDNIRYYTTDANHNVTATIDADSGDVVERYVYSAYGTATVYDDSWANPAASTSDGPMYCGYFFDTESGLYQVRNRYYDSELSVWISRDPAVYKGGDANLFRYVHNNPTNRIDPSGMSDVGWPSKPLIPPPGPTPDGGGGNTKRPGGMGYLFTCLCGSKKDNLSPIPDVQTPTGNPIPGTGPHSGKHQTYPFPSDTAIGGGGAEGCIILIVKCKDTVSVFHFTGGDSPINTLRGRNWGGCEAIICGGNDKPQSNCLGDDVKLSAIHSGINLVGVSGNSGCGVTKEGDWYQYGN